MSGFFRRLTEGVGLSSLMLVLMLMMMAAGCGGGSSSNQAMVRVLQAAPNEPSEDVLVDSKVVSSNLGYGANTGYLSVNTGQRHLQLEPTNSTSPIFDQTLSLSGSTETTVIVQGLASVSGLVLTDNNTAPASGTAMLRLVNVAPSMGPADVYVVAAGTSLTGMAPTVAALAVGSASSYQSLTIPTTGTTAFEVLFTEPGTTLTFLSTGAFSLTSGQNRTVVALNDPTGNFTFATLADLN